MTRQFDVSQIDPGFWEHPHVRSALAQRDIAALLIRFLEHHPGCTQTRLALLIDHDRAEVSNWIGGRRQGRVRDIDVLGRIAGGLAMPDTARVVLGLAPQDVPLSRFAAAPEAGLPATGQRPRLAVSLCGSRRGDSNERIIDAVIPGLARLVLMEGWAVTHGPVGVGIEIMTYLSDHYQTTNAPAAIGTFGHPNVVSSADFVLVIGGGAGTARELDLAVAMGKRVLPLLCAGGAGSAFAAASRKSCSLAWLSDSDFQALNACGAEGYPQLVRDLIAAVEGATP